MLLQENSVIKLLLVITLKESQLARREKYATFLHAIALIKRNRLVGVIKCSHGIGVLPKEGRGGNRISHKSVAKKDSVKTFISSLRGRESDYSKSKSACIYLLSELKSCKNLWKMYNNCTEEHKVSYQKIYEIFVSEFNIGFSGPQVDACTTCKILKNLIMHKPKVQVVAALKLHRKFQLQQCAAFYSLIKNYDEDTYKIVYDLQQVQVLPKVPVQEAFFARQLALYNFAICEISSGKNYCYTWIESEAAHGSN